MSESALRGVNEERVMATMFQTGLKGEAQMASSSVSLCLEVRGQGRFELDTINPWAALSYHHAKPEGDIGR